MSELSDKAEGNSCLNGSQEKTEMKPPDSMCTMKTLFPFKDGSQNVLKPKIFVVMPSSLSVDLTA